MYFKSKISISIASVGKSQKELKNAEVAQSPLVAANAYKVSMMKILQNIKYFHQDVSIKKENSKRMYTPGSASEFETPEARNKEINKTLQSKSPNSKVSQDFPLVNVVQSAPDNSVTGYRGEGPRNCCNPAQLTAVCQNFM